MFEIDLRFVQLVKDQTHKTIILDKFLTNRPDLSDVQVIQYLIKTKHKAIQVNCDKPTSDIELLSSVHCSVDTLSRCINTAFNPCVHYSVDTLSRCINTAFNPCVRYSVDTVYMYQYCLQPVRTLFSRHTV